MVRFRIMSRSPPWCRNPHFSESGHLRQDYDIYGL